MIDLRSRIVFIALALGTLLSSRPASAESTRRLDVSVRVSAGFGAFEEYSWAYPGVDLIGGLRLGACGRALVELQLGYATLDNHTYLADGRLVRLGLAGGVRLLRAGALRLAGTFELDMLAFHADPDVLAEHPGVDILASRGDWVPAAGVQAVYEVTPVLALGLYARAGLSRVALFRENDVDPQAAGEETRARLMLAGVYAQFRVF
jgi:hypothetical protein